MSFYSDLDAGMAAIVAEMFGTATIMSVVKTYDARTDQTVELRPTRQIAAIRVDEEVADANGVLTITTVAYTREPVTVDDRLTLGGITNDVRSVSPIDPAGTGALLFRVVLS